MLTEIKIGTQIYKVCFLMLKEDGNAEMMGRTVTPWTLLR